MLRRRITPKSIFIAPTFSPESLPACAEGYSSDLMGRCIKIIKLDQNQNKQLINSDGMLRRRITPKSIFIAPTFSPESLPACAEGYSSDLMGRCIKIIKLDQDAHYEFLIEKLKEKFSSADYDDYYDETVTTAGPLQVNIPLEINSGLVENDESDEETDIAIIVSPTKTFFDQKVLNLDKRESMDDGKKQELYLKNIAKSTINRENEPVNSLVVTEPVSPTTVDNEETTKVIETEGLITSSTFDTTTFEATTVDMLDLEQQDSTNSNVEVMTTTENYSTVPVETTTQLPSVSSLKPGILPLSPPFKWRFPNDKKVHSNHVKFPDNHESVVSRMSTEDSRGRSVGINHQDFSRQSDDPVVFREAVGLDSNSGHPVPATTHRNFNRRNRDRHNGLFSPRWSQSTFHKPVVLRFSRKSAYIDTNQFKNEEYYRSIPTDDLAYLFKFKHKQPFH
nr:uncharacterized protein LOC111516503 [Leptinotarsa decemlineata]